MNNHPFDFEEEEPTVLEYPECVVCHETACHEDHHVHCENPVCPQYDMSLPELDWEERQTLLEQAMERAKDSICEQHNN